MSSRTEELLVELLEAKRTESSARRESLGPLIEAVAALRATVATSRTLLDELDVQVGVHLELLDAVLRAAHGNRWWEHLSDQVQAEGDQR